MKVCSGVCDVACGGLLLDCVSDAIISVDCDFRIKSWNRAAEKIYGWAAEEALGRNANELLNTRFPAMSQKDAYCALMAAGQLELEMLHTARDGREILLLAKLLLLKGAAGETRGVVAVMHDVTGCRWMEDELKRRAGELAGAKEQLEADLNAMNRLHGISTRFVQEENLNQLLDEIIDAAMEITRADMCAIQSIEPQTGSFRIIAQKGYSPELMNHVESTHSRRSVFKAMMKLDFHMVLDDAAMRPAGMCDRGQETMLSMGVQALQGTPLMSRSGKKIGMLTTMFRLPHQSTGRELRMLDMLARLAADIIERSQSAAALRRTNLGTELLYEVVEKLLEDGNTQGIIQELCEKVMQNLRCDVFFNYLFTARGSRLMRLNACGGISPREQEELEWLERGQAACGRVAETGARVVLEDVQHNNLDIAVALRPLGIRAYACHPLAVQNEVLGTLAFCTRTRDTFTPSELALMKAVSGHVAVAINRARTEDDLKKLTTELSEKNKLITDFFTNISHEFKTPLSIILVDLQLMEYRLRDVEGEAREKLSKMVAVMRQNALRLLRLIGNLLDVTKIDAGFMKARLINTDVVGLVSGIVETVRNYAENAGISVVFETGLPVRVLPLDAEKMERVLLNLLSNAVKHTPEGGHILVSLSHEAEKLTLLVKDDGEGIPEDRKEFIFDRFRQVNTSLTRSSEGCGIGLSLTKALVELLGGKVWFVSSLGRGSEFYVELPVLRENERFRSPEIDGMPRSRKVEMEFSDINKAGRIPEL